MQLGFFFGVPAYFRVCFRILGREDVDLVDLAMALDERPKTKKLLSLFEPQFLIMRLKCTYVPVFFLFSFTFSFHPQGTNRVSGCIQNGVSGCIQNGISGYLQNVLVCGVQLG